MKAVIYTRVSTVGQAEDGVSLAAQEAKTRAWCFANDSEVIGMFSDEGISGAKGEDKRPGLAAAMAAACENKAALVVYSLSRLSRSTKGAIEFVERLGASGAQLVSLSEKIDTTTAMGEFVFTIFAGLGQLERKQTGERTKMALAHKKASGEVYGAIPYGMERAGERLAENEAELVAVRRMRELRAEGETFRGIISRLDAEGLRNRNGRAFTLPAVFKLLKRSA